MPELSDAVDLPFDEPAAGAQVPAADISGLRDAVLAGRFFSAGHHETGERLASFLAVRDLGTLVNWFGTAMLARLAGDKGALRLALDRDIAAIDALLAAQLDAVLHHSRVRRIEGSWRGLSWLLDGIEPGGRLKVRVLNASWAEICRDLERAAEFDQSQLFRKIYEDEFGTPGGEPYGLLLVDHEVRHRPMPGAMTDDITGLKLLSSVAAAAFVPTVLGASPALLEVDGFADLSNVADPAAPLRSADYARWRGLFAQEDIRFLAVTLPRVLAREPWVDDPARLDRFRYAEYAADAESRVWFTGIYPFAAIVARAFANHAWPADIRGVEMDRRGGGLIDHLVTESFRTEPPHTWSRPSLDVVLTDRQERLLVDAGLMPLTSIPYTEEAVFASVRGLQQPATYMGTNAAAANANARLSAQINTLLCVSRFAHYVKMMGRDMVGSFRTAEDIERELQAWVAEYVNGNMAGGADSRSRFPLVAGRVSVRERPGRPGVFGCTVHLQPYFQLDDVSATFRLVTDIAAPGSAR